MPEKEFLPNVRSAAKNMRRLISDLRPGIVIKDKDRYEPLLGRVRSRRRREI